MRQEKVMGRLVTAKTDVVTITSSSHRKMTRVRVRAGLDGFLIDWDQVNDVPPTTYNSLYFSSTCQMDQRGARARARGANYKKLAWGRTERWD